MLFAIVFYNNHKNLSVKCPDKTIYEYENNNLKYKTRVNFLFRRSSVSRTFAYILYIMAFHSEVNDMKNVNSWRKSILSIGFYTHEDIEAQRNRRNGRNDT